ncbi:MAG: hypothetical protein HFG32_11290 [Eubacterium sp.]|jgi:hypothetical protein|nr:hypothetical protein [Eubacterium sp.]
MEQSYAETSVKQKATAKVAVLKGLLILGVILLMGAGFFSRITFLILLSVAALILLIWYWPRFKVEWEYVYCDGQLDFDMIQGGEKRKTVLRIELENAAVIAPMESPKMDGYRHLPVRDFSSLRPEARPYGIAIKLGEKEEQAVLLFEPSDKMIGMIQLKFPQKTIRL